MSAGPRIPLPPVPLPEETAALAAEFADGRRTPVDPRDAATVLLLRDGTGSTHDAGGAAGTGPELYYLRRQTSMQFAAGMAVYPGGGVDPRDDDATVAWAGPTPAEWAERLGCGVDEARALVCAAVRETFEESGVLLAGPIDRPDEVVADTTSADWEADRVALESRQLALTELLTRRGLVLRTDLLGAWDAWLTPAFEPRRYRTWFFVAVLPAGQRTRDVSSESSSVAWIPARVAVDQADAGELALMPPTYLTSMEVGGFDTAAEVLAEASGRRVAMFMPTVEDLPDGRPTLAMPDRLRPLVAARVAGRADPR